MASNSRGERPAFEQLSLMLEDILRGFAGKCDNPDDEYPWLFALAVTGDPAFPEMLPLQQIIDARESRGRYDNVKVRLVIGAAGSSEPTSHQGGALLRRLLWKGIFTAGRYEFPDRKRGWKNYVRNQINTLVTRVNNLRGKADFEIIQEIAAGINTERHWVLEDADAVDRLGISAVPQSGGRAESQQPDEVCATRETHATDAADTEIFPQKGLPRNPLNRKFAIKLWPMRHELANAIEPEVRKMLEKMPAIKRSELDKKTESVAKAFRLYLKKNSAELTPTLPTLGQ